MSEPEGDDLEHIWITSAADPTTGAPACFVVWGEKEKLVSADRIIATCRELHAAAAAADDEVVLLSVLMAAKLSREVLYAMLMDLRTRRVNLRLGMFEGAKPILRIGAFAGADTGKPLVSIELGSNKLIMTSEDARKTASDWYSTAVASILDVRIRHTLAERGFSVVDVEDFMQELLKLEPEVRKGNSPF